MSRSLTRERAAFKWYRTGRLTSENRRAILGTSAGLQSEGHILLPDAMPTDCRYHASLVSRLFYSDERHYISVFISNLTYHILSVVDSKRIFITVRAAAM